MKLKTFITSSLVLSSTLFAGGNIAPVEPVVEEVEVVSEWNYSAAMYMWGAGINGKDAIIGNNIDISFSDILENLDMAFMGTFTAQKDNWGAFVDVVYMKLGNEIAPATTFNYKAKIISPSILYKMVNNDKLDLNLLVGTRYLYMENTITGRPIGSGHVWDGIIGLKGQYNLTSHWFLPFQADIGTGDTDFTWQAFAGIGYAYENIDVVAGWRSLNWNFDANHPGGKLFDDLTISGPMVGLKYRF
jgi:opacity protein-like surface antigen